MKCPEQRSRGEEVLGAQATHVTTSIVILLPVTRLALGDSEGALRGTTLCPFTRSGSGVVGRVTGWQWGMREREREEREYYCVLMSNC